MMARTKIIGIMALIGLLAVSGYLYARHTRKQEAAAAAAGFIAALSRGDGEEALTFLDLPHGEGVTLLDAFETGQISIDSVQEVRLKSLQEGEATITLHIMGEPWQTQLIMKRVNKAGLLATFPISK
jgi:hypothetical protein